MLRSFNSRQLPSWVYVLGAFLTISSGIDLAARYGAAETNTKQLQKVASKEWGAMVVQVERLRDDKWYPQTPLTLQHGFSVHGHSVGEPDFEVRMEPLYRVAGETKSIYLARSISAKCADGNSAIETLLHDASTADWQGRIQCKDGTWRIKVVDAALAARPPVSVPTPPPAFGGSNPNSK